MSKDEQIEFIIGKLATLDAVRIAALADVLAEEDGGGLSRELTARELALLEKSKDDFRQGRTHSSAEVLASIRELTRQR